MCSDIAGQPALVNRKDESIHSQSVPIFTLIPSAPSSDHHLDLHSNNVISGQRAALVASWR